MTVVARATARESPHHLHAVDAAPAQAPGLAVGSRRAGRPPECWAAFDAVVNVTEDEYAGMAGDARYLLYSPQFGLGNQQITLRNAVVWALLLNRTLVLPHLARRKGQLRVLLVKFSVFSRICSKLNIWRILEYF